MIALAAFAAFNAALVLILAAIIIHGKQIVVATPSAVAAWMDAHAIPQWRIMHRLRSVQISIFWAIVGGLWVALPAFQSFVPPVAFACICVGFALAILFARLTKQTGLPDV